MKIVEAITDTNIGGAGVVLLTRLAYSKLYGHDTVVIIPRDSELRARLIKQEIKYVEVDVCRDKSFELFAIPVYYRILKELSPDLVNCHGCLSCRISAFLLGVKVRLYTSHCVFPLKKWQKNRIVKFFFGVSQKLLSNHVIAVAYAARDDLVERGLRSDNISVIINGVEEINVLGSAERSEVRRELNIPSKAIVVGIFARLEEYKGQDEFLQAAQVLVKKSDRYRFLIVGSGKNESKLKAIVNDTNIGDRVIFTGFVDDVTKYLNITDINVNCSRGTETSSLAISEGMSLGIPCVASEYGGNTYMIKNGNNGFTYPVGNYDALAKRIILLSVSGTLYSKMSANAKKRFNEELNAEKMSRQTYELYEKLFADSCLE